MRASSLFRYYAAQTTEPDGETYPSHVESTFLFARREPVGTVLVITPWNFPIAIPAWKIAPALAYGNSVIWKPADPVPLTSLRLLEALQDAWLPCGVLNLIIGRGSVVGGALVSRGVDAISFTGSNAVGRALQREATELGIKVQLEMGGKNPAVVLASADLTAAVERVARGAYMSAGQKCTATSRVIVHESVFDEFSQRLVALVKSWKVGDAVDPETVVGPVVSIEQYRSVLRYLRIARDESGTFLAGGDQLEGVRADTDGYFIDPVVVTGLTQNSRLAREEIFGPVTILQPAVDYDDALRMANDSQYGLSASLFTSDISEALRFANDIQAGVVKINQESAGVEFQVPFGGMKESSSGSREQGRAAREFYTAWKSVYIDLPPASGA